jgi:SAM-dependent methyltransferase
VNFCAEIHRQIRAFELERALDYFKPGAAVLEIGAGVGHQALMLSQRGFRVTAIDLPDSAYSENRVFPIIDYDGRRFPAADASVDIVFSSNVLEHVENLPTIFREMHRVLSPGGYGVHLLPTPAWRFWTIIACLWNLPELWKTKATVSSAAASSGQRSHSRLGRLVSRMKYAASRGLAPHGAHGNAITELWSFRAAHWRSIFAANGFGTIAQEPCGLFYSGAAVWSTKESLNTPARQRLASYLGSACTIFRVSRSER